MKDETRVEGRGEEGYFDDEEVGDKEGEDIEHMEGGLTSNLD